MAEFNNRHPDNVPGKFYTDVLCLDCYVCRDLAPTIFRRDDAHDTSYVFRQPSTPEEVAVCENCAERCPCHAIGTDGDECDWTTERATPPKPTVAPGASPIEKDPKCEPCHDKRRRKLF